MLAASPRFGIVTHYNHLRFRSRLEARWAAMFDLLGWKYEYEPYDLPGWIPDFVLLGREEILVEVKPFTKLEEFDTAKIITAMEQGGKRDKEVLLLGCTIFEALPYGWSPAPCLGWLRECCFSFDDPNNKCLGFDEAIFNGYANNKWGFFHSNLSYADRMVVSNYGGHPPTADTTAVLKLWREAANAVQWRAPA